MAVGLHTGAMNTNFVRADHDRVGELSREKESIAPRIPRSVAWGLWVSMLLVILTMSNRVYSVARQEVYGLTK